MSIMVLHTRLVFIFEATKNKLTICITASIVLMSTSALGFVSEYNYICTRSGACTGIYLDDDILSTEIQ